MALAAVFAILPLSLALSVPLPAQAAEAPPARVQALAAVLDRAAATGFAGEVLAGDADSLWFERAAGFADAAGRQPFRTGGRWAWASVSKQVTAALVMQQVDAGRLRLDDTVAQHLPGFAGPTAAQVTLRQLLQHTSGLPNPDDSAADADGQPSFYRRSGSALEAGALAYCAGAVKRPPGAAFEYNNCDTLLLGALLARLDGKPWAEIVAQRVARPLGLGSLGLVDDGSGGSALSQGLAADGSPAPAWRGETLGAGGALAGTARDLLAFDRALLAHRLVSPASTVLMWTGEPRLGYVALGAWAFPARLPGCTGAQTLVERRGALNGIQVRNVIAPASGLSLVIFTNREAFEFGEVWQGRGLTHDLLAALLCDRAAAPGAVPGAATTKP